ncbi:uncharacterized protein LACBIDRAFT_329630 [Laccaria bicolor S238N-H82]|uniref:Predicted protein n=1 Tax=Laccaria bicolor (strain S238N-H82 / ATCC MYA-4686) TaxID=486041 RepID=B0DIN0_LACBS|nr:uncharacterized protein LACBIDRAFT_329630 [Laccaria bicolor S238N-H82]EDR05599.1 predicted protein [Laccaria bicolor S238N-H82]|eukprot:XP_001883703.1 predicted protein [Laccaria bicolor S238N-H82]
MLPTFEDQNPVHSVSEWTGFWSSKVGKYYITIVSNTKESPSPFAKDRVLSFWLGRISLSIPADLHLHLRKTAFCRSGCMLIFMPRGRISLSKTLSTSESPSPFSKDRVLSFWLGSISLSKTLSTSESPSPFSKDRVLFFWLGSISLSWGAFHLAHFMIVSVFFPP